MHDVEVSGVEVAAGEMVLTALGSANRDPRFWGATADDLDVTRPEANRHLSFGSGVHHCLGAALARMEGEIAITRLVRRFPDLALAANPPTTPGSSSGVETCSRSGWDRLPDS